MKSTYGKTSKPLSPPKGSRIRISSFGLLKILNSLFYAITNGVIRDPIIFFVTFLETFKTCCPVKFHWRFQGVDYSWSRVKKIGNQHRTFWFAGEIGCQRIVIYDSIRDPDAHGVPVFILKSQPVSRIDPVIGPVDQKYPDGEPLIFGDRNTSAYFCKIWRWIVPVQN